LSFKKISARLPQPSPSQAALATAGVFRLAGWLLPLRVAEGGSLAVGGG
jgi:hypothetical protein